MITPSMIYWANECDILKNFIAGICALLFSGLFVYLAYCVISGLVEKRTHFDYPEFMTTPNDVAHKWANSFNRELLKNKVKFAKKSIWFVVAIGMLMIAQTLIPSTKTVYAMYIIPTVTNSKIAQQLPAQIEQYIQTVLKEKSS